jgi:teichoic acid transport system ATP-binding protein
MDNITGFTGQKQNADKNTGKTVFFGKDTAISFENVTKEYKLYKSDKDRFLGLFLDKYIKYKQKLVLNNITFAIKKGASVGILGRNGAGKSTLLKLITGVTHPTRGKVKINGKVSALLELTAGFDPEFTGRENIFLKCYLMGLVDEEINEKLQDIIDFSELGEYIDQPVRTYSSGMKARLGFAVSANINPDILVIDEALSVGDAQFAKKCKQKISEIRKNGSTILFVSHSTASIKDFCTTCMMLEKGKIVAYGNVTEVVDKYNSSIK